MPRVPYKTRDWPISIVGPGAVGSALARALKDAGVHDLTLVGEGRAGEQRLARALKVSHLSRINQLQQKQGIIILALREADLPGTVRQLTRLPLPWGRLTVLHTSGSSGSDILEPLGKLGAGIAAWHPYQTFPKKVASVCLAGVTFGVGGNPRGVRTANQLTRILGGLPLKVADRDRALYHLSAVLACGFIAADLQMAMEVLKGIGVRQRRALQTVLPIAAETLKQIGELGVQAAMTGPAVRGDMATIRKHLAALRKMNPELAKVYSTVTDYVLTSRKQK